MPFPSAEFEGDEYYKTEVKPQLEDGSALKTSIYVWQESARRATFSHHIPCLTAAPLIGLPENPPIATLICQASCVTPPSPSMVCHG